MSGKRAKPSPWRFLPAAPLALVGIAVWVIVGMFFLLPGPGSDQAGDWGLDPIPSNSDDEVPGEPDPSATRRSAPAAPATSRSHGSTTEQGPAPEQAATSELASSDAPAPARAVPSDPPPGSDSADPAPSGSTPGPPEDNPGKKKGHDKPHGPHGRP